MEITREEVIAVAELAKLALSEEEITLYGQQLNHILEYVAQLNAVDTSQVPPTASVLPVTNVLRQDVVGAALAPAEVTANAAEAEDNQFRVSAVLDNS